MLLSHYNTKTNSDLITDIVNHDGAMVLRTQADGPCGLLLSISISHQAFGYRTRSTAFDRLKGGLKQAIDFEALKPWSYTVVNKDGASQFTVLNMQGVRRYWDQLQVRLPAKMMVKLSRELGIPVWPSISVEAEECTNIQADWRHANPYIGFSQLNLARNASRETRALLVDEISRVNRPVYIHRIRGKPMYALSCQFEDCFPADTQFKDLGLFDLRDPSAVSDDRCVYRITDQRGGKGTMFYMTSVNSPDDLSGVIKKAAQYAPFRCPSLVPESLNIYKYSVERIISWDTVDALMEAFEIAQQDSQGLLGVDVSYKKGKTFFGIVSQQDVMQRALRIPFAAPIRLSGERNGPPFPEFFSAMSGNKPLPTGDEDKDSIIYRQFMSFMNLGSARSDRPYLINTSRIHDNGDTQAYCVTSLPVFLGIQRMARMLSF